jgi:hypothetical protein
MDEWPDRRRDLDLTIHKIQNREIFIPPGGIRTHDLCRRAAEDLRLARNRICSETRTTVMGKMSFDFLQQYNDCLCSGDPLVRCRRSRYEGVVVRGAQGEGELECAGLCANCHRAPGEAFVCYCRKLAFQILAVSLLTTRFKIQKF